MGFFDRFRKKEEPPAEEPLHRIRSGELSDWTDRQFEQEIGDARKRAGQFQDSLNGMFSDARESFTKASKASIEGDDRMVTMANMTKDSYVNHAISVIQNLRLPRAETYQELISFRRTAVSALRDMNTLSPKQAILLRKYFDRESSAFAESLKRIDAAAGEMKQFLDSDGKVLEAVSVIRSNAEKMASLLKRSSELDSAETAVREEIDRLDGEKRNVSGKLQALLKGSEWSRLKSLHELAEEAEKEADNIESETNAVLRTADRPLKKLAHLAGTKGSSVNPFREFILGGREDEFMRMLSDAEKSASDGRISLNPKESEKLDNVIAYLSNNIPVLKKRHMLVTESARNAKAGLSESRLPAEKAAAEEELADTESALRTKWSELDDMIREKKSISAELQEMKAASEKMVADLGKKVEIIV